MIYVNETLMIRSITVQKSYILMGPLIRKGKTGMESKAWQKKNPEGRILLAVSECL